MMTSHEQSSERSLPTVEHLSERFGTAARASTVFGEPVARNGVTIVPVASAKWGLFGGWGGGQDTERGGSGSGGGAGGGLTVSPVGYIEIKDGSTCYRPLIDPLAWFKAALIGGVLGMLISRVGRRG